MNAVERLLAIEEIRDLVARYNIVYDDHDWGGLAELWMEDAAFVVNGVAFEGRATLLEFLTGCLPDGYFGKHLCSPSRIALGDDGATATAQTDVAWIAQNFETSIVGRYDDTFAKVDGRWLFARREESTVPFKPGFPPYSEAATSVSGATMRTES